MIILNLGALRMPGHSGNWSFVIGHSVVCSQIANREQPVDRSLFYFGLTHQSTPLAVRERLRPDREEQIKMLAELAEFSRGRMILSTCERFEIYTSAAKSTPALLRTYLGRSFDLPASVLERNAIVLDAEDTAKHLLRVTAGLESRILGEAQILGQVRDSYMLAGSCRALDPVLSALGRAAIHAGKRVRSETQINSGARSIATITMDWLARHGARLADCRVLILGSGALAAVVAAEVERLHPIELFVVGRTAERCQSLAQRHRAIAGLARDVPRFLSRADVVVGCAAAGEYILDVAAVSRSSRPERPLYVVDLAVPRNIDPALSHLPFVRLVDLDQLTRGEHTRNEDLAAAQAIVSQELGSFLKWSGERGAADQIRMLLANYREASDSPRPGKHELHLRIQHLKSSLAA